MEWNEGKKNNIRALLCSMHMVLWDNTKWNKVEMHQLVSAADVKKAYRKACLAVHPDKVSITTLYTLLIFLLLCYLGGVRNRKHLHRYGIGFRT